MVFLAVDSVAAGTDLVLVLLGIGIAIAVPYIIRRNRRSTTPPTEPVRNQWERQKSASRGRAEADRILVELVETSREISARMDTKIRILNTLIRDAERCIARLETLQDGKDDAAPADAAPMAAAAPPGPDAQSVPPVAADAATRTAPSNRERTRPAETAPQAPAAEPEVPGPRPADPPPPADGADDTVRQVVALGNEGFDVPDIARRLDISRQEVNLILRLHATERGRRA
ncbi:MAG: hypothetical protein ACOCX4_01070 [Planctomycetota bacterium]